MSTKQHGIESSAVVSFVVFCSATKLLLFVTAKQMARIQSHDLKKRACYHPFSFSYLVGSDRTTFTKILHLPKVGALSVPTNERFLRLLIF
jgi:hypothetical protein